MSGGSCDRCGEHPAECTCAQKPRYLRDDEISGTATVDDLLRRLAIARERNALLEKRIATLLTQGQQRRQP